MKDHILEKTTFINQPLDKVFDFFSKAENLNKITPPELSFKIITPLPIKMQKGTLIDYKIKVEGIPMLWRTEISDWNPPYYFIDSQLKGPYVKWVHEHHFESVDNGTKMTDKVTFRSPGWIFEPIIHYLIVKNKVEKIFEYREKILKDIVF